MEIFCLGCDKPMIIEETEDEEATARCLDCGTQVTGFAPHPLAGLAEHPVTRNEIIEEAQRLLGVRYITEKYVNAKGPMSPLIYEAAAEVLRKQGVREFVPSRTITVLQRALEGLKHYEMFK